MSDSVENRLIALFQKDLEERRSERADLNQTLENLSEKVEGLSASLHHGEESVVSRIKAIEDAQSRATLALFTTDGTSRVQALEGTQGLLRQIVFGFVALVLVAVVGGLIALVVTKDKTTAASVSATRSSEHH